MERSEFYLPIAATLLFLGFASFALYLNTEVQQLESELVVTQQEATEWENRFNQAQAQVQRLNNTVENLTERIQIKQDEIRSLEEELDQPEDLETRMVEREIHRLINIERANRSEERLSFSPELQETAESKNQDMIEFDYFAHDNPETGRGLNDILESYNVECWEAGENIQLTGYGIPVESNQTGEVSEVSTNAGLAEHIMKGFMSSEGHRETILDSRWNKVGIAVTESDNRTVHVTQHFCRTG